MPVVDTVENPMDMLLRIGTSILSPAQIFNGSLLAPLWSKTWGIKKEWPKNREIRCVSFRGAASFARSSPLGRHGLVQGHDLLFFGEVEQHGSC